MKAIKGLGLFFVMVVLITSCFDPPEFSNTPTIKFENLYFGDYTGTSAEVIDSLVLTISFKDGDGDLGVDPNFTGYPFQRFYFYIANNGVIDSIPVESRSYRKEVPGTPPSSQTTTITVLDFQNKAGKLVTLETLNDPQYADDLPDYTGTSSCVYRELSDIYIRASDESKLSDPSIIAETVTDLDTGTKYHRLHDTFYRTLNQNTYNITIDLFDKNNNPIHFGDACSRDFDGRFPVLTQEDGDNPLEGTLQYSMKSAGIVPILGVRPFGMKIQIKDRAFNRSNVITTKIFVLEDLRR